MIVRHLDSHIQFMLTSYVITLLLCAFSLCYLMIKSERSPLRSSFIIVQAVTIIWIVFALREKTSLSLGEVLLNMRVTLTSINFTAPLWLITILLYTEHISKKNWWLVPIIITVPVILSIPLLAPAGSGIFSLYIEEITFNEMPRIYTVDWGPFEILTGIAACCGVFLCSFFLLFHFRNNKTIKMNERIVVLLVMLSPLAAYYSGLALNAPFDLAPLAFSLWGATIVYLSFNRQFFNAVPSLVWNIFNVTKESMVVLGADGSINVNKAFVAAFGSRYDDFMQFAYELSPEFGEYISEKRDVSCLEVKKNGIYYELSIHNVFGRRNNVIGQLVTIKDVTESKQLTLESERSRIASGLHDSMGNRLITSINNLNLALIQPTIEEGRPFMDSAATSTVASLMMLRKIVEGLSPVNYNETRLTTLIESVIDRISASGVYSDLQIVGDPDNLPIELKEFIYNTCQEALTNSVIHGKAENVIIRLECAADMLKLDIVDDGRGCDIISKNNGLTAMEDRAKALGGIVRFGSPSLGGFGIYAKVPVKAGDGE